MTKGWRWGIPAGAGLLGLGIHAAGAVDELAQAGVAALQGGAVHAATSALAAALASRLAGRLAGGCAGLLVALLPLVGTVDPAAEQVGLLVLVAVGLAGLGAERIGWMAPAGLSLGLAALQEPRLLWTLPLLLLAHLGRPLALLLLVVGLLAPIGLSARQADTDEPLASSGLELVLGQGLQHARALHPWAGSEPRDDLRLPDEPLARAERSRLIASRQAGRWLTPEEEERHWWSVAWTQVRSAPQRTLALVLVRAHLLLYLGGLGVLFAALALAALNWPFAGRGMVAALALGLPPALALGGLQPSDWRIVWVLLPLLSGLSLARLVQQRGRALGLQLAGLLVLALPLALPPLDPGLPLPALAAIPSADELGCGLLSRPRFAPRIEEEHLKARQEIERGELESAAQRLGALLQAEPRHVGALVDLSAMILDNGDPRSAGTMAERALELDPCDPGAWVNLGTSWMRQGKIRDAARAFGEARTIDPWSPVAEAALGEALLTIGETERGLALLESSVQWGPKLWQPRSVLGRRALTEGRFAEAERLLAEAVASSPERPELLAMLGLARLGLGRLDQAEEILAQARSLDLGRHGAILTLDRGIRAAREAAGIAPSP